MARIQSGVIENEALRMIATLMASSARTAPKARGIDDVQTLVLDGEDLEMVAAAMEEQAKAHSGPVPAIFIRDCVDRDHYLAIFIKLVHCGLSLIEYNPACTDLVNHDTFYWKVVGWLWVPSVLPRNNIR